MPFLIVLSPDAERGRRIEIGHDMVVGRGDRCDIRFDDPFVSRTHAGLRRHGRSVWVQDLGSAGGTFVNGVPAQTERELRPGDVLALADIKLRYDDDGPANTPEQAAPRYDIGYQRDGVFHNVAGNQYIVEQRESFMRSVAARKSKARWLIVFGFLLFIAGTGVAVVSAAGMLNNFGHIFDNASLESGPPSFESLLGGKVLGVPVMLAGSVLDAAGLFLIIAGIVLHVVATARARDVDRQYPMPYPR
jgi:uncharacterized membrane protein